MSEQVAARSTASGHSRRGFLARASVGAAAVGAAVVVPGVVGGGVADAQESGPAHAGEFVVWVKDPRAGELAVLVGERELTVVDRKLAKRLAQAAARAARS